MAKRKGLARGLDDLLAQHDTELDFLSGLADDRIGIEVGSDAQGMFAALQRHLRAEAGAEQSRSTQKTLSFGDHLSARQVQAGVRLKVKPQDVALPLVPSDLMLPGMEAGELSADRKSCSLLLTEWNHESRRLISRLIEHWSLE
jgi:hypothetical protein